MEWRRPVHNGTDHPYYAHKGITQLKIDHTNALGLYLRKLS